MTVKKTLLIFALLGVIGGFYGFYMYNKPSTDVSSKKVEIRLDADQLVSSFQNDETKANTDYLNKVVLVSGKVMSIISDGKTTNILLETSDLMSSVSCEFAHRLPNVKQGDRVSIKGQCAGYLLDVVLVKCVIQI